MGSLNAEERPKLLGVFMFLFCSPPPSFLQRSRIQVWLYEQVNMRIEGCIIVSIRVSPSYSVDWVFFQIYKALSACQKKLVGGVCGNTSCLSSE